jgi:exonuclease SbcD
VRAFSSKHPETVRLEELGVAIHGQSFPRREVTEDISAGYPPAEQGLFNIGILHTSVTGRPGHDNYAPCSTAGLLAKDYEYWALGHVHTREILHEDPWIVFPGNIQGRDMGEKGAKGCMLVTVEDGAVVSVEQRETNVMRWQVCEVDASGVDDMDSVLDLVRTAIRRDIEESTGIPLALRVRIYGACEAHPMLCSAREHWIAEVRNCATDLGSVWVEKVQLHTSQQHDLAKLMGRDDPLARLVRSIHEMEIRPILLDEFQEEWADLKRKLPFEMRKGEGLRILDTDAKRQQCLEDVRQLLLPRLLSIPETR